MNRLRRLDFFAFRLPGLSAEAITDAGAILLARWPGAPSLQALNLSGNAISDAGLAALLESPHLHELSKLEIHGNPVSDAGWHLWGAWIANRTSNRAKPI